VSILVVIEQSGQGISKGSLSAIAAAQKIGAAVDVVIFGSGMDAAAKAASGISGIAKVLVADSPAYAELLAEPLAEQVIALVKNNGYTHVLCAATSVGKDFMPRVAALLDVAQISEIIAVISPDTFRRPIYAGNAIETVQSNDAIKIITVRPTAFDAVKPEGGNAEIIKLEVGAANAGSRFVSKQESKSERPELASARIVISGGRGLGSAENFQMLERIATKLGAAIGASRAAVDAGYVPNDYQVGQTGKVVAPDLYIAVGISGAIQHLAGMKDSKVIVAINKDENAPIFEIADYGLVADLFTALPELEKAL
jgi:electron transfer flavoprotein alpha subunit